MMAVGRVCWFVSLGMEVISLLRRVLIPLVPCNVHKELSVRYNAIHHESRIVRMVFQSTSSLIREWDTSSWSESGGDEWKDPPWGKQEECLLGIWIDRTSCIMESANPITQMVDTCVLREEVMVVRECRRMVSVNCDCWDHRGCAGNEHREDSCEGKEDIVDRNGSCLLEKSE